MKRYIVTLLKDLPEVEAGFSFHCDEEVMENFSHILLKSQREDMTDSAFTYKVQLVLKYQNMNDWVKIIPDYSNAVPIGCPNCGNVGMFPFTDEQLDREFSAGILRWYRNYGVECLCGNRVYTHRVCIKKKKTNWQ